MRRWGTAAIGAPAIAAGALVALASPVAGQPAPRPLLGDIDGDGIEDRATLTDAGATCGVDVALGDGSGGYGPVTTYTYPAPGDEVAAYCPDLGVIVDLGGDGVSELVLAWFSGSPWTLGYDLLVLEDFQPAGGFAAQSQPSSIGLGEFNGDGLTDVWEATDQGSGFTTYLNTPAGELVAGPLQFAYGSGFRALADFDEDGATDLVVDYEANWQPGEPFDGLVVVLDDGTRTFLRDGRAEDGGWGVEVLDEDGDGHLDIRAYDLDGDLVTWLGNGDGTFTSPK